MTNAPAVLRMFITYAVCVVLAIILGFFLAGPLTYSALGVYALVGFVLLFPILLKWHYPLLLLSWNFAAVAFLLPGHPTVGLTMVLLSLGVSVFQRMLSRESQFISVPQITLPLFAMLGVIAITAKLTGFGLHVFGSSIYGGKKYVYLIGGILGYFALSARRIPPERRNLYLGLFFLGGLTTAIGDLVSFLPHQFYFIYYFFHYNWYAFRPGEIGLNTTRFSGAVGASLAVFSYMLARYGVRGVFLSRNPWRWVLFVLGVAYGFFGGFRGLFALFAVVFAIQFFLERMYRTKLLPIFLLVGIIGALALIPLTPYLPFTFQRVLSFLPYKVSTAARLNAESTLTWRLRMWRAILPEVPHYLLLGKGYVLSPLDYEFVMGPEASIHNAFARNDPMALAEDFHNGPLSVVIPFGIWGCFAYLWFVTVALWVLYRNYRYGDPALSTINSFLLAAFLGKTIIFLLLGGDLSDDMLTFCGFLGLSVAFNGGVRRRARVPKPVGEIEKSSGFARRSPSPAPAFQRRLQ